MKIKRPLWQRPDAPISCRQLAPVLQGYLDGQLDDDDIAFVEAHLDACRDCGLEAETYEAIKESLGRHEPAMPDDILSRLSAFSATLSDRIAVEDGGLTADADED